jgi:hypothetical protein
MIDGRTLTARLKKSGFKAVTSSRTSVRGFHRFSKGDFACSSFQNKGLFYQLGQYERIIRIDLYDRAAEITDAVNLMDDVKIIEYTSGHMYITNN